MDPNTVHVLLVDDDADYVSVVQHHLHSFAGKRFQLTWVNDGEKALAHLKSGTKTDLIIMDYYLPSTNGISIMKQILEEGFAMPVILLTSNKDFRIAIEAMKYGIEEYLVKEEMADTILPRTIINVLERVRLQRQIGEAEKEKLLSLKKTEAIQELVVTMCHEFNNPLAAIKISADILSRQKISDDERQLVQQLNASISLLEKQIIRLRDLNSGAAPL
ncbi:MAG: response regulator [Ignavibacteriae bacterium]|nr:response regulator [Ignavibacteria bacterium]MBI3365640.1 response regulator [Ignavibacteriota bacterium]